MTNISEIEENVLGGMLQSFDALSTGVKELSPIDFSNDVHSKIFRIFQELYTICLTHNYSKITKTLLDSVAPNYFPDIENNIFKIKHIVLSAVEYEPETFPIELQSVKEAKAIRDLQFTTIKLNTLLNSESRPSTEDMQVLVTAQQSVLNKLTNSKNKQSRINDSLSDDFAIRYLQLMKSDETIVKSFDVNDTEFTLKKLEEGNLNIINKERQIFGISALDGNLDNGVMPLAILNADDLLAHPIY